MNTYKVLFVGEGGVGKTVCIKRADAGLFEKKYIATLGVEVSPLQVGVGAKKCVLNIWDCAGQEKFSGLGDGYYVGADVVVLCFDLSCGTFTFTALGKWLVAVRRIAPNVKILFCGMKSDAKSDPSGLLEKTIPKLVERGAKYLEVSSKTGKGVSELFLAIAEAGMSK